MKTTAWNKTHGAREHIVLRTDPKEAFDLDHVFIERPLVKREAKPAPRRSLIGAVLLSPGYAMLALLKLLRVL